MNLDLKLITARPCPSDVPPSVARKNRPGAADESKEAHTDGRAGTRQRPSEPGEREQLEDDAVNIMDIVGGAVASPGGQKPTTAEVMELGGTGERQDDHEHMVSYDEEQSASTPQQPESSRDSSSSSSSMIVGEEEELALEDGKDSEVEHPQHAGTDTANQSSFDKSYQIKTLRQGQKMRQKMRSAKKHKAARRAIANSSQTKSMDKCSRNAEHLQGVPSSPSTRRA